MSHHRAPRRGRHAAARPRRARTRALVAAVPVALAALALPFALGASGAGPVAGPPTAEAVTAGQGATAAPAGPSGALDGTDAVGYAVGSRGHVVSRDSERQALSDVAGGEVQPATEDKGAETNAALKSLGRAAEEKAATIALDRWVLPTTGYRLTARFGQAGGRWVNNHTGLDFAAPTGTPIVAVAGGTITGVGWAGAYGNRTVETLEDGTELWYCHQSAIQVKPGQEVTSGQRIGLVGATGNVTGPHLHLEVRPGGGDPVDPYQALVHHGLKP